MQTPPLGQPVQVSFEAAAKQPWEKKNPWKVKAKECSESCSLSTLAISYGFPAETGFS